MSIQAILLPLFVEVLVIFGLLVWMAVLRGRDLRSGRSQLRDVALREPNWSPRTLQAAYCFSNQFELPVLFFVLTILVIITKHGDLLFVLLAWVFVVLRILHAGVYLGSNDLRRRGPVYGAAAIVLFIMWIVFMVRILLNLP